MPCELSPIVKEAECSIYEPDIVLLVKQADLKIENGVAKIKRKGRYGGKQFDREVYILKKGWPIETAYPITSDRVSFSPDAKFSVYEDNA